MTLESSHSPVWKDCCFKTHRCRCAKRASIARRWCTRHGQRVLTDLPLWTLRAIIAGMCLTSAMFA